MRPQGGALVENQKRDREPVARSTCATLFQGCVDRQGAAPCLRYDVAGEDVNLKCSCSFSRPTIGKFAFDIIYRDLG